MRRVLDVAKVSPENHGGRGQEKIARAAGKTPRTGLLQGFNRIPFS